MLKEASRIISKQVTLVAATAQKLDAGIQGSSSVVVWTTASDVAIGDSTVGATNALLPATFPVTLHDVGGRFDLYAYSTAGATLHVIALG